VQDDASLQLESTLGATSSMNNSESAAMSQAQGPDSPSMSEKADSVPGSATIATQQSAGTESTFMRVAAHLGRLALHASARAADDFWPPPSVSAPSEKHGPTQVGAENSSLHSEGMVDQERPLISIIAEGGLLKYQQVPESVLCVCRHILSLACAVYAHAWLRM
jgi:hypothetical protein